MLADVNTATCTGVLKETILHRVQFKPQATVKHSHSDAAGVCSPSKNKMSTILHKNVSYPPLPCLTSIWQRLMPVAAVS